MIYYKSWQQHPTRHQLYGHLPPITKTIQVRRTRHAGHCWRSRDELIRDVLLWIPTHGRAKAGWPARTYIQQLCEDTGCCPEDLPRAMNDREEWRERVRDIRAASTIWWWWWHIVLWVQSPKAYHCLQDFTLKFIPCMYLKFINGNFFTQVVFAGIHNKMLWMVSIRFSNLLFARAFFQAFSDRSKCANYNWYHGHFFGSLRLQDQLFGKLFPPPLLGLVVCFQRICRSRFRGQILVYVHDICLQDHFS